MPTYRVDFEQNGVPRYWTVDAKSKDEAVVLFNEMVRQETARHEAYYRNPQVTDRALRYRANHPDVAPEGPKRCMWCGHSKVEVAHIDGNESNTTRENLAWTCRSCNVRCANTLRKAGVGRLTHQYNPSSSTGAKSKGQYAWALRVMRGDEEGDVKAAARMVQETPPAKRTAWDIDFWKIRKQRYGPSGPERRRRGAVLKHRPPLLTFGRILTDVPHTAKPRPRFSASCTPPLARRQLLTDRNEYNVSALYGFGGISVKVTVNHRFVLSLGMSDSVKRGSGLRILAPVAHFWPRVALVELAVRADGTEQLAMLRG